MSDLVKREARKAEEAVGAHQIRAMSGDGLSVVTG